MRSLNKESICFIKKKQPQNQFTWTCTGPRIPNLSLMWPAKPKELPTPAVDYHFD